MKYDWEQRKRRNEVFKVKLFINNKYEKDKAYCSFVDGFISL
jgi:hypothetical protein